MVIRKFMQLDLENNNNHLDGVFLQEDQDTEWKFSRSKIYMDYIKEGATLPVPLNLLPSFECISEYCCCCYKRTK